MNQVEIYHRFEALLDMAEAWQIDFEKLASDPAYKPKFNNTTTRAREAVEWLRENLPETV